MEINQGNPTDLIEILYLLKVSILDMNAKGFNHWNSSCPGSEIIQSELENGNIYLAKDNGVCKGMVTLSDHQPDDYKSIDFPNEGKRALYLRNMVVHPNWQGMGIARQMISFAEKFANEKGFDCIRLDVFKPSEKARSLYEKQLFREVASFHYAYQQIPFVCYEKKI